MVETATHPDQLFAGLQIKRVSLTQWRLVATPDHRKDFEIKVLIKDPVLIQCAYYTSARVRSDGLRRGPIG